MHLALHVLAAARALEKSGQKLFKPHGLTIAQFNVLNLLADAPDGLRASELARSLIVDASNVTGLVKRMKGEGFLRDVENTADRRQHVVGLTPKGKRVWELASRDYLQGLTALESALTPADRRATERALSALVAAASTAP